MMHCICYLSPDQPRNTNFPTPMLLFLINYQSIIFSYIQLIDRAFIRQLPTRLLVKEIAQITSFTEFQEKSYKATKKLKLYPSDKPQWKYGPQMFKVTSWTAVIISIWTSIYIYCHLQHCPDFSRVYSPV